MHGRQSSATRLLLYCSNGQHDAEVVTLDEHKGSRCFLFPLFPGGTYPIGNAFPGAVNALKDIAGCYNIVKVCM